MSTETQEAMEMGTKPGREHEWLQKLVGEWRTEGVHPMLPGKALHGRSSFAWSDGGAFLVMRSEIEKTSSRRWLMKTIAVPWSRRRRTMRNKSPTS